MQKQKKWRFLIQKHKFLFISLICALIILEIFWGKIRLQRESITSLLNQVSSLNQFPVVSKEKPFMGVFYCMLNPEGEVLKFTEPDQVTMLQKRKEGMVPVNKHSYKLNLDHFRIETNHNDASNPQKKAPIIFRVTDLSPKGEVLGLYAGRDYRQEWCKFRQLE